MGSDSKHDGYSGAQDTVAAAVFPATLKEVVQSMKEIVNCFSEHEIYAALKDSDMDPNRAVERLLTQDTFHEVRSKRERRKEMKEALDSRIRGSNGWLSCGGGKTSTCNDRNVTKSGSTYVTYNEQVKPASKGEVGSVGTSGASSTTYVGKSVKTDSFSTNNGRPSLGTRDSISVLSQVSSGLQTSLLGVSKGQLSMADIVRMGRTAQNAVSYDCYTTSGVSASGNSESKLDCLNHSEQQVSHDEWPVNEQPIPGDSQNIFVSSNAKGSSEHSSFCDTTVSLHRNCELDAPEVSWGNVASNDAVSKKTGLGSHSNPNLKDTCSSDVCSSNGYHEDVSSAASDFQRLSITESRLEVPIPEDKQPTLVLPNHLHLQSLAAKCSHLSFGSYNGTSNNASSVISASNLSSNGLEEMSAAVDSSSTQFSDDSSIYHGDKQLELDPLRGREDNKNEDFLSSPQHELLKNIIPEEALGHEFNTVVSVSDPSLQQSHWGTPPLPLKQPGLQSGSHSDFPIEMMQQAESNSIPGDVLAFLRSQSQPAEYSNTISAINNSANSISEVMERGPFALPKRSALPQDRTLQSSAHFQQLPDMEGFYSHARTQPYMTNINSQQGFPGNIPYNQSPVDMKYNLPQNINEFQMSGLPPARARDRYGYGNLGSSHFSQGSYLSNPSRGYMMPSSNSNDILRSQYNGGHNLSSIQQHDNLSLWNYVPESRSPSYPERTQYNNFLGQQHHHQNMASVVNPASQYVNHGYSDLHHSQRRAVEELQRQGSFQDLLSKEMHQLWKHIH